MRHLISIIAAILFSSAPFAASAAPVLNGSYLYHFTWGKLHVGSLVLKVDDSGSNYTVSTEVVTTGAVDLFAGHKSTSFASGVVSSGKYSSDYYETFYVTGKKSRHVTFNNSGGKITQTVVPDNDSRPPVDDALKAQSLNPLNIMLAVRAALFSDPQSKMLNYTMFDGRKAAKVTLTRGEDADVDTQGYKGQAAHYTAKREAIAGFKDKELKKIKKGEPLLHIYFSKTFNLPVMLELKMALGMVRGELIGDCAEVKCPAIPSRERLAKQWEATPSVASQ